MKLTDFSFVPIRPSTKSLTIGYNIPESSKLYESQLQEFPKKKQSRILPVVEEFIRVTYTISGQYLSEKKITETISTAVDDNSLQLLLQRQGFSVDLSTPSVISTTSSGNEEEVMNSKKLSDGAAVGITIAVLFIIGCLVYYIWGKCRTYVPLRARHPNDDYDTNSGGVDYGDVYRGSDSNSRFSFSRRQ